MDGQIFSAENATIWVDGLSVAAATAFSMEEAATSEDIHVIGKKSPAATIVTKVTYKGNLTLMRHQYDSLQRSLPKGRSLIDAMPMQIQFSYASEAGLIMTHEANGVKFNNIKMDIKGGDSMKEVPLDFTATEIRYNVGV